MAIPLNDLSRTTPARARELEAALRRVTARGWYLLGPEVEAFEAELAAAIGVADCVGVASGTDALGLALAGVGCAPGDEVLTAANAGGYTVTACHATGLRPRLADVDDATLCLSAATVDAALTQRTRAVVVTHLYGRLAAVEEIVPLCRARGVAVVEDCAQAIGARRGDARAGASGDAAAFSFYPTKNLGALGDGGAVATDDPGVAERVRRLAQYGWEGKYRVALRGGRNSRLDELQAATLRASLPHLADWNGRRRTIALSYAEALDGTTARLACAAGPDHVAHLAVLRSPDRDGLRQRLEEAGVQTAIHYPIPDHRQPAWRDELGGAELPVTERATAEILTVPCFPELTDAEVERVAEALRAAA
jgi:dTDP-4-amino-4,6-dideoxygalactose transaminase